MLQYVNTEQPIMLPSFACNDISEDRLHRFRFPLSTVFCNIHRHYHHQHFLDANIGKEMNGHFSNVEKLVLKEKYIASEKWCRLQ